jgi:MFS transporter, CP family, cyanate transporter
MTSGTSVVPRLGLLVAMFSAALALRPQLVGIGPLIPEIQDDLDVSHAVAGLLATIPVLCMGLFAPAAPYARGWLGSRRAMTACLLIIASFGVARAFVPGIPGLLLLTFGVGIGMGLAGALLPVTVKERFADRPAFATGTYATGINLGAALSAAVAVPIADAAFGWQASLLVYSLFTCLLVVAWVLLTRGAPVHVRGGERPPRLPFGSLVAWILVAVFFLMAVSFYGLNAWLSDAYVERGWSTGNAGALVAVFNALTVPAALIVPWFADRFGSRRAYLVSAAGILVVALLGAVEYPGGGWVWAVLVGIAFGTLFPLVMTLPLDVAHRPAEVGAVTGLMLGAGYSLAALSPFVLGAVRDATGSFTASLWLIVGVGVVLFLVCLPLSRERLHRAAEAHAIVAVGASEP